MNLIERSLRLLIGWAYTTVYWTFVLLLHLVSFKRLPAEWLSKMIQGWGWSSLWILGIRLEILNESTLSTRAPRVMICNHQSALDLCWGAAICPPAVLAIGKREIIYIPVFNMVWWILDLIRIDRSNRAKAIAALSGVSQTIVREKRTLLISPEGTRTPDGSILPFKKGAFHIAREAQVPICPVVVEGAYELLHKKEFLPRKGVIKLRFLPPVSTVGLTRENENEFIARVREDMIRAYQELRT